MITKSIAIVLISHVVDSIVQHTGNEVTSQYLPYMVMCYGGTDGILDISK